MAFVDGTVPEDGLRMSDGGIQSGWISARLGLNRRAYPGEMFESVPEDKKERKGL